MKKFAIVLVLASLFGTTAFATANSCGTAAAAPPSGTVNPTIAITLAAANLVDANERVAPTDAGCQVINKVFDNFSTSGAFVNNPTDVTLLGTDPGTIGTQQNLRFFGAGIDWTDTSGGGAQTSNIYFLVTPVLGSGTAGLREIGINATNFSGSDSITVQVRACFIQATACTGSYDFNQSYVFAPGQTTLGGLNFSSFQTSQYSVRLSLSVADNTGGTGAVDLTLNNFHVEFEDTPEPSTFGLMAASLAGLGFLARRRRKS
jgi:hypothetical protein